MICSNVRCVIGSDCEANRIQQQPVWFFSAVESLSLLKPALDRALLRPTASYAGDPEECRRADGSPQEPGIGNVFDGSGDRAAFAGAGGRSRGA